MTDECTSKTVTTVEYITSATLKMRATRGCSADADYAEDRPDALGMLCGEESNNASSIQANGDPQTQATNGKIGTFTDTVFARMPVERNAMEYNMNHKKRGLALIFNHEFFDVPYLQPRTGTNIDCDKLKQTFEKLEFDVSTHQDCKLRDLQEHIRKASSKDHSDHDCIVLVILSHGEHGYLYAKDVMYKLDTICHYFTAHECPTLAGKPKLLLIQACRGDRLDPGIRLQKTETDGETSSDMSYRIPVHADFLISYSTIPGFYSWRNPQSGSWFIQSLVEELNTNGKKYDILTLLTFVNQRVALNYESNVPSRSIMDQQKQIPCITSMLMRILRFTDKTFSA